MSISNWGSAKAGMMDAASEASASTQRDSNRRTADTSLGSVTGQLMGPALHNRPNLAEQCPAPLCAHLSLPLLRTGFPFGPIEPISFGGLASEEGVWPWIPDPTNLKSAPRWAIFSIASAINGA